MDIKTFCGVAHEEDIKVEPYNEETYTLCYINSDGEGNYDLFGFDAPTKDDNVWRFWVESGDDNDYVETNNARITDEEKEYIKHLYYEYKKSK